MSQRKRNMLEAFQASAQEPEGAPVPGAGGAGGPFADQPPPSAPPPPRPEPERVVAPAETAKPSLAQALAALPLGPIAIGELVLLALVFWLGTLSGGSSSEVAAREGAGSELASDADRRPAPRGGTATGNPGPASAQPAASQPGSDGTTPYDRAFYAHARDGITLRVASYDSTERNAALAWKAYDYLLEAGLPVVRPLDGTENIFLFVGAAPRRAELEDLRTRVAELPGPDGDRPFRGAYFVNISDFIQR